jgi:diguanylate cyclase (GGDEF)-like protein
MTNLFERVFHAAPHHIAVLDEVGEIIAVNAAWLAFGQANGAAVDDIGIGRNYVEICTSLAEQDETAKKTAEALAKLLTGELEEFSLEYTCHSPTKQRWFTLWVRPLCGEQNNIAIWHTDITEQKLLEIELAHIAHHDELTGAFTRHRFYDELNHHLALADRYNISGSILLLDLDNLKCINDAYGHQAGDAVLVMFSKLVQENTREVDIFARVGGDEFVLLLPSTDEDGAALVAAKLLNKLKDSEIKVNNTDKVRMSTSIGIVAYPEYSLTSDQLMVLADQALYAAKENGGSQFVRYGPDILAHGE